MMSHRLEAGVCAVVVILLVASCSREQPSGRKDTVTPPESLPHVEVPIKDHLAAVWDTAAGAYFAIPAGTPGTALIVYPGYDSAQRLDTLQVDTGRVVGLELELLGADSVIRARVGALEADSVDDCVSWPVVSVRLPEQSFTARPWAVGFPAGRATVIPFDSLASLSRADSTRLTIAIARAASKVQGDTAAAFRGRPFVVRQANRFRLDGREVVVAEVARVVTQEANPLQEQLLLILEGEAPGERPGFNIAYALREIGLEEALEAIELTSVLRFRSGTWGVLLHREVGDGARFELYERQAEGRWIRRWRSAYAGC